ncbi:MAG: nuclear transport factor 2 family protein [Pseudomonadota bacterium]
MTLQPISLFVLCCVLSAGAHADDASRQAVDAVLDDFHAAAAAGDRDRYLGLMTENGVFLGTDEWERWPKDPDFTDYVSGRFSDGGGWTYRSVDRNVDVSPAGDVAWFDEVVFSETNGRFRGTGVLLRRDGQWRIAHYAMSFLIFNEDWPAVVELTRKTRLSKDAE